MRQSLGRPYPVTIPMVLLMGMVPAYIFIASEVRGGPVHRPAIGLDAAIPVWPVWAIIYGALYLWLILMPVFVVREEAHVRRTFWAYLSVWIVAYVVFFAYPTGAPRPKSVDGDGFAVWGLLLLYASDPPYNCFPSLHVAHSFISALTCYRVHHRTGQVATVAAALVAISTLFTKQHWVLDVIAGAAMAYGAYWLLLRNYPREKVGDVDREAGPIVAGGVFAAIAIFVVGIWVAYQINPFPKPLP